MRVEVKVRGAGRVQHRCSICGEPVDSPVFETRDGQLVALHPEHKENSRWPQTRD